MCECEHICACLQLRGTCLLRFPRLVTLHLLSEMQVQVLVPKIENRKKNSDPNKTE